MKEDKIPYLVENKERDTFTIYVKGTKPYLDLQQENKQLKKKYENAVADYEYEKCKNSKAIEYIKNMEDFSIEEYETLLEILGEEENE